MFDTPFTERRRAGAALREATATAIQSYWQQQLRPAAAAADSPAASASATGPTPRPLLGSGPGSGSGSGSGSGAKAGGGTPRPLLGSGGLTPGSGGGGTGSSGTPGGGLTDSSGSSASARRALRKAARSAERHRADELRDRFGSLAKPLFQNYLLPQFEPHEACPALTVVFDLDETLVSNRNASLSSAILRPYALHVLNALRHMKGLEVVMWTASTKSTATPVVKQLSMSGTVFDETIFRSDLWFTEPLHTKDLRLLGRDVDRLLIVDNAAGCCKLNPQNAILIEGFYGARTSDDAALVNVYYTIERVLKACHEKIPVSDTLRQIADDGRLCQPLFFSLPDAWKNLPLRDIAPLKIPPHGRFTVSNSEPLDESVMQYWTM